MEFDLPKRDILINEAMNGAKAAINDFGALAQDPTFLSLAKVNAGQSTASPAPGATGGLSTVRNVLPGLSPTRRRRSRPARAPATLNSARPSSR